MNKRILIVSNSEDAHANLIQERISERGIGVSRLDSDTFATSAARVWRLPADQREIASAWNNSAADVVWYRKVVFPEGEDAVSSFVRQELTGLFDSVLDEHARKRWVNKREAIARAAPKIAQLQCARNIGLRIPDSVVTNDLDVLREFAARHEGDIVAKPLRAQVVGMGDSTRVIGTRKLPRSEYEAAISHAPCFAQERLPIRSEIRVVAFGKELYPFRMTVDSPAEDIKQVHLDAIRHELCTLDASTERKLRELVDLYELEFAAIDLVETEKEELVFLELNPNGQWLWLQLVTGVNLADPFIDFLCA